MNHVAIDVSGIRDSLSDVVREVNQTSIDKHGKGFKVLTEPRQQMIGRKVWEMCYISDNTGALVELLNEVAVLEDGAGTEMRW